MEAVPKITKKEIALIKRAQGGDIKAFNTLFYKYKPFVEGILKGYLKDTDEAKFVANEVFLKVYENLSTFKTYDSFGGWLRIITNRTAVDYLRSIKHDAGTLSDGDVRQAPSLISESYENDLVNRMTYEQLLYQFNELPESTRKVFELFYENSMTVEEISKALKMPTGTIKARLARTRRKLKKHLKT